MSGKVHSLYDETPKTCKLRKDQERRILEICRDNAQFPRVALGLVQDYIRTCSASQIVETVRLTDDREFIEIYTISDSVTLGTTYKWRFNREPRLVAPTL
jgi:hypothetical protein